MCVRFPSYTHVVNVFDVFSLVDGTFGTAGAHAQLGNAQSKCTAKDNWNSKARNAHSRKPPLLVMLIRARFALLVWSYL